MQTNQARKSVPVFTAGGAPAYPHLTPLQRLRRSALSCLLWEDEFYQDGKTIADQISEAASAVSLEQLASVAIEARTEHNLRHVPLLLLQHLVARSSEISARTGGKRIVSDTIAKVIQRADELSEFLALYWAANPRQDGQNAPLAKQIKIGLRTAFQNFDQYQLAKYDRAKAVRLRDVMFLVHPKPRDEVQAATWKMLANDALPAPDTWEVELSAGADKRATFERLIRERRLGYFALLRNLRNMAQAGCDDELVREAILARKGGAERILPFRFVAAARACPQFEREIDQAMVSNIEAMPKMRGTTIVLVDVSGSMDERLSARSDLTRVDAAAALAVIVPAERVRVFTFSTQTIEVPARRGMGGIDAIKRSQVHSSTYLAEAVAVVDRIPHDRLIVITDEQAQTRVPDPVAPHAYMINVASNRNGVGYGKWTHIDGFSESVIRWMHAHEQESQR